MRPITDRRERLDDRRRRAGLPPTDADVLGREIDPRLDHAVDPGKRVLDGPDAAAAADPRPGELALAQAIRPAARRGGKECVSTCRSRCSAYVYKNTAQIHPQRLLT